MAFKGKTGKSSQSENPASHLKTLTKRQIQDVLPHQKSTLLRYAAEEQNSSDIALQLPTGGGKTLVGLLIADWRRSKSKERVLFLCPTVQLVAQTVEQATSKYGIEAADFSGKKAEFDKADATAYQRAKLVGVTTYNGLFNSNPFFSSPNLIIADDAHVAENYIAGMWTLELEPKDSAHSALIEVMRRYLTKREISRLTGDWNDPFDATWVDKLPSPIFRQIHEEVYDVLQAHIDYKSAHRFTWNAIKDHLQACHIYLGSKKIVIRPLVPPTWTHAPFANADQRIYMSATLGEGGDTERLVGRHPIRRMPSPEGFEAEGVGRRFFLFPTLSLDDDKAASLRLRMQAKAGRSVVLTPSKTSGDAIKAEVKAHLPAFKIFSTKDIESKKSTFAATNKAVAVLPGRFDGIDFPGDECRLLCIDGFPGAMNLQERFLMTKMGAKELYDARIQTRVLQAIGRCTRALNDRSAVLVTGKTLVDHLADQRRWPRFNPELQAELGFGAEESTKTTADAMYENFEFFLDNNADWQEAESEIRDEMLNLEQVPFESNDDLAKSVGNEIKYVQQMWNGEYRIAAGTAKEVQTTLNHASLRGYRALWSYLEGSAVDWAEGEGKNIPDEARSIFARAARSARAVSWLTSLSYETNRVAGIETSDVDVNVQQQIERVALRFDEFGVVSNAKFEKAVARIQKNLKSSNGTTFEKGVEELGQIIGFQSDNTDEKAAPDPWWFNSKKGLVFEAFSEADETTTFGSIKARQASGHPKWLQEHRPELKGIDFTPVLITDAVTMDSGAGAFLEETRYWKKSEFLKWSDRAIGMLRELKGQYSGEGDLAWSAIAMGRFEELHMSYKTLMVLLPLAKNEMNTE